jgi:hypothetical protein
MSDGMPGGRPTTDPKPHRITVRINHRDLTLLEGLARERGGTVGEVVRDLIRAHPAARKRRPRKGR